MSCRCLCGFSISSNIPISRQTGSCFLNKSLRVTWVRKPFYIERFFRDRHGLVIYSTVYLAQEIRYSSLKFYHSSSEYTPSMENILPCDTIIPLPNTVPSRNFFMIQVATQLLRSTNIVLHLLGLGRGLNGLTHL